jgi:hypothetical protein
MRVVILLVLAFLLVGLIGSTYASVMGLNMTNVSAASARAGSLRGPMIIGGGPGSGK